MTVSQFCYVFNRIVSINRGVGLPHVSFFEKILYPVLFLQEGVHKVKHILAIHAEDTAGTGAVAVDTKGCNASNNIAVTQEVGAAGVAKAGAAGRMIIGK